MAAAGYTVGTAGAISLSAATAKTVLAIVNSSTGLIRLVEFGLAFDGISATAVPVLIELTSCSTTGAGTYTSHTIQQTRGATRTVQASGRRNYTVEPSTQTTWKRWLVHPQSGIIVQFPLSREPEIITASFTMCLRLTAPAAVNCQGYMEFEEG